jgi:hypothetical protein
VIELKTHGGLQWVVERRFSQFYTLNQARAGTRRREGGGGVGVATAVCVAPVPNPSTLPPLPHPTPPHSTPPYLCDHVCVSQVLKQRYEELRLFKFPQKKWFSSFATATGEAPNPPPPLIPVVALRFHPPPTPPLRRAVEQRRRVFEVYLHELVRAPSAGGGGGRGWTRSRTQ